MYFSSQFLANYRLHVNRALDDLGLLYHHYANRAMKANEDTPGRGENKEKFAASSGIRYVH